MIADCQTIAGVPSELEIAEVYQTNVLDAIKNAKSHISLGKTNVAPTILQKTVMAEVLNALGFYSEKWGQLLGTSTKVIIKQAAFSDITQ